jgi:protein TonB
MGLRTENETYLNAFTRRNGWTWGWSAAAALAANLVFFAGMPLLLQRAPVEPVYTQRVDAVNVIRIRRPEPPARRETTPPPEPEKSVPKPVVDAPASEKLQLALPFEINPRLPAGPATLQLPPVETLPAVGSGIDDIFEAGQLDAPLTVLARMPPLYPLEAKRRGIEGWVKIRFLVNAEGTVEEVRVVESRPPGVFESSVKRTVPGWRFQPGTVEGIPVRTRAETTIRFELN